jgi:4-amino-4-deoxy-L-arabinose transferase-like glycosyltransferase
VNIVPGKIKKKQYTNSVNPLIKHKHSLILFLVLFIGFLLCYRTSRDQYLHKWDERYHALVAKNMMQHPLKPTLYETPLLKYDHKVWYANHIWLHKQPLPLWLISFSYYLFGIGDLQTRIPSMIFFVLGIFITYTLGKELFNKNIGLLAAFFHAINGLIIEMASGRIATDHYDSLYLVLIEIAILFALCNSRSKNILYSVLSGAFIGFAILTKWLPCLIVIPIHYFFLKDENTSFKDSVKQLSASILTCLMIALPWQLYVLDQYPLEAKWEYFHNWLHITEELDQQTGSFFYYLNKMRINYSEIIYIPLAFLLYILIKDKFRQYPFVALFIWIFVPLIFFSFAHTKMQGYILFISPALFLLTAYFFYWLKNDALEKINNKGLKALTVLFLIAIIILPLRYCFERTSFGLEKVRHETYVDNYRNPKFNLSDSSVVFNVKQPIEFMFYNKGVAYSVPTISEQEIKRIGSLGYSIYYMDDKESTLKRIALE